MDFTNTLSQIKTYLSGLSASNPAAATTGDLTTINTELNKINNLSSDQTQAILSNQATVKNIVDIEKGRLDDKADSIKQAKISQERLIELNQSYSKRYGQYIYMLQVIVVALLLLFAISLAKKLIPDLPGGLTDTLTILIIGAAICYCLYIYNGILGRDNMDFDKIASNSPNLLTPAQIAKQLAANQKSGNLLGSVNLGYCFGESCCGVGSKWDAATQMCIPDCSGGNWNSSTKTCADACSSDKPNWNSSTNACADACPSEHKWDSGSNKCVKTVEKFTTLSSAYGLGIMNSSLGKLSQDKATKPYDVSEFDSYGKY